MADTKITSYRYVYPRDPVNCNYTKTFTKAARVLTTATDAGYSAVPLGYYAAFAGFGIDPGNANVSISLLNPNASGTANIMGNYNTNTSSNVSDRACMFSSTYIRSDLIDDQRDI